MLDTFTVKEAKCIVVKEVYQEPPSSITKERTAYLYELTTDDGRTLRYDARHRKKSFPPAWPFYVELRSEDRNQNRFTITLTDELAREYMDEPDGPSPDIAQVKLAVMSDIVCSATSHYLKRQAEDDKRRESSAKEKTYKEERAKQDDRPDVIGQCDPDNE